MKNPILPVYLLLLACLVAAFALSCASQAQFDAGRELAIAATTATDPSSPGGATITPEEEVLLKAAYEKVRGAEGIDWSTLGAGVLASLAGVFPLLRFLPNRYVVGTQEAAALDKAAGLSTG